VFGAFLVGLVLRETRFVHQALAEITPLRNIFATLFFVSLGMLLDPIFLVNNWALILFTVAIIIFLKSLVVLAVVRIFGYSFRIAIVTGAGLFQIGEFGFILAQGGIKMGIVSEQFYSLIVASAIITMLLTPISINLTCRLYSRLALAAVRKKLVTEETLPIASSKEAAPPQRVVIAGYGRIGQNIAQGLRDAGIPYIVVDIDPKRISDAQTSGRPRVYGDATNINVLSRVGLGKARALVVTYPDPMAIVTSAKIALSINPKLKILARVDRLKEADTLKGLGVTELVSPEYEASFRFIKRLLNIAGLEKVDRKRILSSARKDKEIAEYNPDQSA